jgi:hypothetical protein
MQKIEHLVLPLRRTPRTKPEFWYMVCASFERGKISYSVWISKKIIVSYKTKSAKTNDRSIDKVNKKPCIPKEA